MSKSTSAGSLGGLILGLLFAVIGYFVAFSFGKPILDNAKASKEWPSTSGQITSSSVATKRSDGKTKYSFDVVYKYQAEGKGYTASNVYFGGEGSSSNSSSAHKVVNRYPKGKTVDVFYEPGNPSNAVLEPGTTWASYMVYGIGMAFLVIGVLVAGSSLFTLLAIGAVVIGAVSGMIGGSSNKNSRDQFQGSPSPGGFSRQPLPNAADLDDEDDGFGV